MAESKRNSHPKTQRESAHAVQPIDQRGALRLEDVLTALGEIVAADRRTLCERASAAARVCNIDGSRLDDRDPISFARIARLK